MRFLLFFVLSIYLSFSAVAENLNKKLTSNGDLAIGQLPSVFMSDALPGDTVSFFISGNWSGDGAADNVVITDQFPDQLSILSIYPEPATQSGGAITWDYGTVDNGWSSYIVISAVVKDDVPLGTEVTNTVSITGNVTDTDMENNVDEFTFKVQVPSADVTLFQWGLMESLESGMWFQTEIGVTSTFTINYFNFSFGQADNVVVTDTIPAEMQYVSANPAPSSINGNVVTWALGSLEPFAFDKIDLKMKTLQTGSITNTAYISTTSEESNTLNNKSSFTFTSVTLLPPLVLKPAFSSFYDDTLITSSNPTFEGLARAGATVTLYEGDSLGFYGDFENSGAVAIGSTVAGPDRKWTLKPTTLTESKNYYLYVRAEYNGEKSKPLFNMWNPNVLRVEALFDSSGFDVNYFSITNGDQTVNPGALGGTSGTTPEQDLTIRKRQKAPDAILTDTTMWKNHMMKLVIHENGTTREEEFPVSSVERANLDGSSSSLNGENPALGYWTYDFIYVHKGFGPGAKVEVWCLPVYYNDEGLPIYGLVWVKCHEILIDPAGYVYDIDLAGGEYLWPEVPPENSLIKDATVSVYNRTGDDSWELWDASASEQYNPQVTDDTYPDKILIPGYFAFYVPSGQYQVKATAPNYADYTSPILTVVDEPVFHNVGMHRLSDEATGFKREKDKALFPQIFTVEQNYPNPFNSSTTIEYYIPNDASVSIKIFDVAGKEVGILVNNEFRTAGKHRLRYDASSLASGIYFYTINVGKISITKKFILMK